MGVYPGTIEKTFLEICEEQAAQGNPAAAAFVAKKKHLIPPAVVTTDKITEAIEEKGFQFLPAIDPVIEAQIEREKAAEKKLAGMNIKAEYDPEVPDDLPY